MAESKKQKKVCRDSGIITTEDKCPITGSTAFLDKYKGEAYIYDAEQSLIAKKMNVKHKGNFALKYG